jgi:hypothetical protein
MQERNEAIEAQRRTSIRSRRWGFDAAGKAGELVTALLESCQVGAERPQRIDARPGRCAMVERERRAR